MTLEDKDLDALLRNVEVPSSLKDSLLEIPDRDSLESNSAPSSKSWSALLGTVAALAASVLIYFAISGEDLVPGGGESTVAKSNEIALLVEQMEQNRNSIDSILLLQNSRIDRELETDPILDARESVATALSLSWQAAIDQGASFESVQDEVQYVVDQFPGTSGALRAQQLLQIN